MVSGLGVPGLRFPSMQNERVSSSSESWGRSSNSMSTRLRVRRVAGVAKSATIASVLDNTHESKALRKSCHEISARETLNHRTVAWLRNKKYGQTVSSALTDQSPFFRSPLVDRTVGLRRTQNACIG